MCTRMETSYLESLCHALGQLVGVFSLRQKLLGLGFKLVGLCQILETLLLNLQKLFL